MRDVFLVVELRVMKSEARVGARTKLHEKETEIQKAICDYLAFRHHFFWRSNNTPIFQDGKYRAMPRYGKTGVPDIILIKEGIFYGLEVKTQKGVISPSQEAFRDEAEKAGGRYYVVRNIDDVVFLGL